MATKKIRSLLKIENDSLKRLHSSLRHVKESGFGQGGWVSNLISVYLWVSWELLPFPQYSSYQDAPDLLVSEKTGYKTVRTIITVIHILMYPSGEKSSEGDTAKD